RARRGAAGRPPAVSRDRRPSCSQRPIEIVDSRQQLTSELDHPALLRGGRLTRGPLAIVLKVGLGPLGQLQVLIGLLRLRGQVFQIPLEHGLMVLRLRYRFWLYRRLGVRI